MRSIAGTHWKPGCSRPLWKPPPEGTRTRTGWVVGTEFVASVWVERTRQQYTVSGISTTLPEEETYASTGRDTNDGRRTTGHSVADDNGVWCGPHDDGSVHGHGSHAGVPLCPEHVGARPKRECDISTGVYVPPVPTLT